MNIKKIYLAGGCFWGVEEYFKQINGVVKTSVGYANGDTENATYETIKQTNHAETVEITYNSEVVGLLFILDMYYKIIDPTSVNKQGNDVGTSYRTGIYYTDENELILINNSIKKLEKEINEKTAIEIEMLKHYVKAEDYHQDYLENNPGGYCHIGSDKFSKAKDSKPLTNDNFSKAELKEKLTDEQYRITQEDGTESPYENEFWDFYEDGIYLDITSGIPLFCSKDKFPCHGGWPSFAKPISEDLLMNYLDTSFGTTRTEVRTSLSNSHLGHVFDDGPSELGGRRFCINSASLEFVPKDKLKERGFSSLLSLFE